MTVFIHVRTNHTSIVKLIVQRGGLVITVVSQQQGPGFKHKVGPEMCGVTCSLCVVCTLVCVDTCSMFSVVILKVMKDT